MTRLKDAIARQLAELETERRAAEMHQGTCRWCLPDAPCPMGQAVLDNLHAHGLNLEMLAEGISL